MIRFNKIFGIGLPKTGTKSLQEALNILGISCFHAPGEYRRTVERDKENFPRSILDHYDAFCDSPFDGIYRELDRRYPGSKFILTYRDLSSWLKSRKKHVFRNKLNLYYKGALLHFDRPTAVAKWQRHNREVSEYFRNRETDLLILNIVGGEGWDKLCGFFDIDKPEIPFPHKNRSSNSVYYFYKYLKKFVINSFPNISKKITAKQA